MRRLHAVVLGGWLLAALVPVTASAAAPRLPDVVVPAVSVVAGMHEVSVDASVANTGRRTATGVEVAYVLDPGGFRLGIRSVGALAIGARWRQTVSLALPAGLDAGNYELTVVADPSGRVRERDEGNNRATVPVTLSGDGGHEHLEPVDAAILGTCTAEVHDRYTVNGADGATYRTWHPQAVDDGRGGRCRFAHEHGDDPSTSRVNPAPPAFGYVGRHGGHDEAHEGFKVSIANAGEVNDEGRVMLGDSRVVFHMGTGGPRRFSVRHHSAHVDVRLPGGPRLSVQGMFDTGSVGSICERDRSLGDADPSNDVGRAVVTVPGTNCALGSPYEIWQGRFDVTRDDGSVAATAFANLAVFDAITALDPTRPSARLLIRDVFADRSGEAPFMGPFHGCEREAYHSLGHLYNERSTTVYFTDAVGRPGGSLRQEVSADSAVGTPMASDGAGTLSQFKLRRSQCAPGLGELN